jgi:hypothetical protein
MLLVVGHGNIRPRPPLPPCQPQLDRLPCGAEACPLCCVGPLGGPRRPGGAGRGRVDV